MGLASLGGLGNFSPVVRFSPAGGDGDDKPPTATFVEIVAKSSLFWHRFNLRTSPGKPGTAIAIDASSRNG
jgi:hypothetical protein